MTDAPKETMPAELNLIIREAATLAHGFVAGANVAATRPVVAMMAHALAMEALARAHGYKSDDVLGLMAELYGATQRAKVIDRIAAAAVAGATQQVVQSTAPTTLGSVPER